MVSSKKQIKIKFFFFPSNLLICLAAENKLYLAIQYPIRLDSHPTSSRLVRKVKPSPGKLSLMAAFLLDDEAPDRVSKLLQDDPGKPPLLKSSASSSPSLEASSSSASSKSRPMLRRSSSSELVGASGDLVERAISMDIFVPSSSQDVSDLPPSARPRALLSTPPPTQSELDTEYAPCFISLSNQSSKKGK